MEWQSQLLLVVLKLFGKMFLRYPTMFSGSVLLLPVIAWAIGFLSPPVYLGAPFCYTVGLFCEQSFNIFEAVLTKSLDPQIRLAVDHLADIEQKRTETDLEKKCPLTFLETKIISILDI